MFIPKVAASAQFADIKGSSVKRYHIAEKKNKAFSKELRMFFKKSPVITQDELNSIVQKHLPGIKFELVKNTIKQFEGAVGFLRNAEGSIDGFKIGLPFAEDGTLPKEQHRTIIHEMRHVFDRAVSPKYTARQNIKTSTPVNVYETFYQNYMYINAAKNSKSIVSTLPTFEKNVPSAEKIEILQLFRHRLKSERNAYGDEIKLTPMSPLTKIQERIYNMCFFFDDKIRTLRTGIEEEIKLHRQIHAKMLHDKK